MASLKYMAVIKFRTPSILQGECVLQYKLSGLLMVSAEKWSANLKKWGVHANLPSLNSCVSFVFPIFSVFKVVYHEYPCAFSVKSVDHAVVSVTYPWVARISPS